MFVILVAGLFQDLKSVKPDGTKGGILLNYLSSRIYYHNVTRKVLEDELTRCGVTDISIQNNMWFDESYGFKTLSTFNVYLRINFLGKTNIRTYLQNYFGISEPEIKCLTLDKDSMIEKAVEEYLEDLHSKYDGDCVTRCTQGDYAMIQWGQNGITDAVDKVIIASLFFNFLIRKSM